MKNVGSEPEFRVQLWPAKTGNIMVKHMDDQHLQNAIMLISKMHVGARKERSALVNRGKSVVKHFEDQGVDIDEALNFVRDKMRVMKKWLKILKKERSYRKHRGITVAKGSTVIMPDGATRMLEGKIFNAYGKPYNPDKD